MGILLLSPQLSVLERRATGTTASISWPAFLQRPPLRTIRTSSPPHIPVLCDIKVALTVKAPLFF